MILSQAKAIAMQVKTKMAPYCELINIAGSVRRLQAEVHDIEIVCSPKIEQLPTGELFSPFAPGISPNFIKTVESLGTVIKGKPTGRMMQIQLSDIMLDLFIPQRDDYYRQYAIRTGSKDYARFKIADGWRKIGWVGTADGLRLEKDCFPKTTPEGKTVWYCRVPYATKPPAWDSEKAFFDWINVSYVSPSKREI